MVMTCAIRSGAGTGLALGKIGRRRGARVARAMARGDGRRTSNSRPGGPAGRLLMGVEHDGRGHAGPGNGGDGTLLCAGRRLRPALRNLRKDDDAVLYFTAVLTLLALIYLGYAMIRPEKF